MNSTEDTIKQKFAEYNPFKNQALFNSEFTNTKTSYINREIVRPTSMDVERPASELTE